MTSSRRTNRFATAERQNLSVGAPVDRAIARRMELERART
jgi:hypothetical protein